MIEDRKRQAELDHAMWARADACEVPDSSVDDLDGALVDTLLRNARAKSSFHRSKADEVVLRNLGAVSKDGRLTVAGAYVLGEYPQRFLPSWSATAAVQPPDGVAGRTRDLQHFEGPLPAMFMDIREWVSRNVHSALGPRSDGNAVDEGPLPAVTVRELVVNALVHRDLSPLSHGRRVEIRLTGDQLSVSSPGGLRGITTAQLGHSGGKRAVNETVYSLCEKLTLPDGTRLIEGEGGGIREARERMTAAGLRPPRLHDTGVSFTAIVSRRKLLSEADSRWLDSVAGGRRLDQEQRIILASMRHGRDWTNKMVRDEFDRMDSREAKSLLQDLVGRNLAVAMGKGGGARHRLADHLRLVADDAPPVVVTADGGAVEPEPDRARSEAAVVNPTVARPAVSNAAIATPAVSHAAVAGDSANAESIRRILAASDGPRTTVDLVSDTGLTARQVRYALIQMSELGHIYKTPGRPARWGLAKLDS